MAAFHTWPYRKAFNASYQIDSDTAREIADELVQADADYAAANTVSGGDLRKRYA
jgi:hypothetical protein